MATLTREQVVANWVEGAGVTTDFVYNTLQVTKTATMTHGTLLLADGTEAADLDITNGDVAYVIDDLLIKEVATGDEFTARVVEELDLVKFYGANLKVGSTALSGAQLTAFGKKYA